MIEHPVNLACPAVIMLGIRLFVRVSHICDLLGHQMKLNYGSLAKRI